MKTERVIEPNQEIQFLQKQIVDELTLLLPGVYTELIGAMTVPMVGRPEIDVMILSDNVSADSLVLANQGYRQGPVEKGVSYLKKYVDDVEVGVQIMPPDHKMVGIHRKIISLLRSDEALKKQYEQFKRTLSGLIRTEYKEKKSAWIREHILPRL